MSVLGVPGRTCGRGHDLAEYGKVRVRRTYTVYTCTACPTEKQEPDPVVVARVVAGERPDYVHGSEMLAAVTLLTRRGLSTAETARVTGISARTVCRMRRKLREGTPYGTTQSPQHEPAGCEFRAADHG
jgi:hypothetical protein